MASGAWWRAAGRGLLDFVLPARCAACGTIVAEVGLFCADCWARIEWLGDGCERCAIPLPTTDEQLCAACLADPPQLDRVRAAVGYGEIARSLALRLKYGRKTAIAGTMARYMRRHLNGDDAVIVPVPLHRLRLWQRGFNQSALIARALGSASGLPCDPRLIRRRRRTPPLKGMSPSQRRRTVAGAFAVAPGNNLAGRTVILVDDVYTTGSTANACAHVLKRAGAARVELIAWARVLRPATTRR